jgi:hypothetical protein
MSSVAPSRADFDALLKYVKNPKNRVALLSNTEKYDAKAAYWSCIPIEHYLQKGDGHALTLHKLLHVVLQLALCRDFNEITRQEVVNFIAQFNTVLKPEPTFDSLIVSTYTFGEEALRILKQMRYAITREWKKTDPNMLQALFV